MLLIENRLLYKGIMWWRTSTVYREYLV